MNKEKFYTDFFDFFANQGYGFYQRKENNYYTHTYLAKNERIYPGTITLDKESFKNYYINKSSYQVIPRFGAAAIYKNENNEQLLSFLIKYMRETKKDWKDICKKFGYYINYTYDIAVLKTCNEVCANKEDVKNFFKNFQILSLKCTTLNLDDLNKLLEKKGFSQEEKEEFFFDFFKARKSQLGKKEVAPIVRDFLLKLYDSKESKLEKYFDFFNFLKASFVEIKADIFDNEHLQSFTAMINLKKMSETFCLDSWSIDKYEKSLKMFLECYKNYFKIPYCNLDVENRMKKQFRINVMHNFPAFNKENLQQDIISYYRFLAKNLNFNVDDKNNISTWIERELLDKSFEKPNEKIKSKIKI